MNEIDEFKYPNFPITDEQLMAANWSGLHVCEKFGVVFASIEKSKKDRSLFDCAVFWRESKSLTKQPVRLDLVAMQLAVLLDEYKFKSSDLKWKPQDQELRQTGQEVVYFLKAGNFIKIGKSTGSPAGRVFELQTGCPFPIEVIGYIPGGYELERKLHKSFAMCHAHGEWFHAKRELTDYVSQVTSEIGIK